MPAPDRPPLLIDVEELAALLGRSVASLARDDAAGRLPTPVRLGASKKFRMDEVIAWVAAGCPPRAQWTYAQGGRR